MLGGEVVEVVIGGATHGPTRREDEHRFCYIT